MTYRIRNTRTDASFTIDTLPATAPDEEIEWILEYEWTPGEWRSSGYHIRDIVSVQNPRSFAEIAQVLRNIVCFQAAVSAQE